MSFFKPLPGDSQEEWEREMREAEAGRLALRRIGAAGTPLYGESNDDDAPTLSDASWNSCGGED